MQKDGVIKFNCNWIKSEPLDNSLIHELNTWRKKMYDLHFIGVYPDGIGYGNISIRHQANTFIISGSATGHSPELDNSHYTLVTQFDLDQNTLTCQGPIQASSESLTHAALYSCNDSINAIIHIHNLSLWKQLLDKVPTTSPTIEYGTPAMAFAIQELYQNSELPHVKLLAMGGHEEGIIAFGKDLDEAGGMLLRKMNVKLKMH